MMQRGVKIRLKFFFILFTFLIPFFFCTCGQQKTEWHGTIEEVDGVTVVRNPKEPIYGDNIFVLKEELSIGEAGGREEYMFSSARSLAVDLSGNIYVMDVKETHVKVFNKDGKFLRIIGRAGQGPGEFGRPRNIQITHNNELMINDSGSRKLLFYSLNGQYIKEIKINTFAFRIYCDSYEQYYAYAFTLNPPTDSQFQLLKINSDLSQISVVAEYKGQTRFEPMMFHTPHIVFHITANDYLLFGYPEDYEIQIFHPNGNIVKKIYREYEPVPISKEEKDEVSKRSLPGWQAETPNHYPAYQDFKTDDKGRIYVITWEKQPKLEGYSYDVFDSNGKYITRFTLRALHQIWRQNKLYTIEEDEDGYEYVKRYSVTWNY